MSIPNPGVPTFLPRVTRPTSGCRCYVLVSVTVTVPVAVVVSVPLEVVSGMCVTVAALPGMITAIRLLGAVTLVTGRVVL